MMARARVALTICTIFLTAPMAVAQGLALDPKSVQFVLYCEFCDAKKNPEECKKTFPPSYFARVTLNGNPNTFAFLSPAFGTKNGNIKGVFGVGKWEGDFWAVPITKPFGFRGPEVFGLMYDNDLSIFVLEKTSRGIGANGGSCKKTTFGKGN